MKLGSLFAGRVTMTKRTCSMCLGPKDFYARTCRSCAPKPVGCKGLKGPAHPTWKGGYRLDRDGYIRTYAPDHPWPRKGGYVPEHVRVMELHIDRRLEPGEVVHHRDGDRRNNALSNLEVKTASEHSRDHRLQDTHLRQRDARGRFA
jgi:hypothetical protein